MIKDLSHSNKQLLIKSPGRLEKVLLEKEIDKEKKQADDSFETES